MNDTDLATLVRGAVHDTRMTVPEADITRRARTLRTRRRITAGAVASASVAAIAVAVATIAVPAGSPAPGRQQDAAQLTAWTVTNEPGGVVDVTIRQLKDPADLQARLRADGVPAIVTSSGTDPACRNYYPDGRYFSPQWLALSGPGQYSYDNGSVTVVVTAEAPAPHNGVVSEPLSRLQGFTVSIRPARMPHGTAFLIAARPTYVYAWGLVKTSPSCTA
jgi:hypothetical protein